MKELSIEEKAKAYDEALKEAVIAHKDEDKHLKATLERIFPEIKESEDERIKQSLINYVYCHGNAGDFTSKEFIAWIEKQGEQIDLANKEYWRGYREGKQEILDKYSELEKQGEKGTNGNNREIPNSDWSEEDEKTFSRICGIIHHAAYENYDVDEDGEELGEYARIINWFKSLKGRYTWKPSEEQIEVLNWCKPLWNDPKTKAVLETLIEGLKKLKEK